MQNLIYKESDMRVIEVKKLTEINLQDYLHASNSNKTELARFAYHIQGKIRGVKFGIHANTMDDAQCRLHVYYPDDKYAMGYITYYTLEGLGFYTVNARDIYNERSRNSSPNMKKSQNIQVALRTACKFLKRFTPLEEVCCSHGGLDGSISGLVSSDRREFTRTVNTLSNGLSSDHRYLTAKETIPDQASFINEIRNILAQHDFADPGVKAVFASLITSYDDVQVAEALRKDMYTYIRLVEGERVVMMSGVPALAYTGDPAKYYDGVVTRTTHAQVPEYIQNAVSTLFLLADGEFVSGLGLRVDEFTYYVLEPKGN
jgi:hypothetical protein